MIMKMIENTLYHPHNLCSADQVVGHVRSLKAESFPMPARTPSKAAIRLWRWVATSCHFNKCCVSHLEPPLGAGHTGSACPWAYHWPWEISAAAAKLL